MPRDEPVTGKLYARDCGGACGLLEARLIDWSPDGNSARLRLEDGKVVTVPRYELSQDWQLVLTIS